MLQPNSPAPRQIRPGAMVGITTSGTSKVIGQTRMTIFENGYVGIGVTWTPTAELTVGGKVRSPISLA